MPVVAWLAALLAAAALCAVACRLVVIACLAAGWAARRRLQAVLISYMLLLAWGTGFVVRASCESVQTFRGTAISAARWW